MNVDDDTSAGPPAESAQQLTAVGSVILWLRETWSREPSEDEVAAVDDLIPQGGPEFFEYVVRFSFLILLSASIAAFGLLADSSAVVIGAMLVAPMMTPITAVAGAIVTARNPRLWRSFAVIAWGVVLAVAVGWLVSVIAGGTATDVSELPNEVRARTFPGLLDLGIAVTAGAAAGYILPRKSTIGALPGVGIAVALVPPLATVGIALQYGFPSEASNAFLLFLTNLVAIVFAASVALVLTGFRPSQYSGRRALRTRMAITLVVVAVIAIPLTVHTFAALEDTRLRRAVVGSVQAWDDQVRIVDLVSDVSDGQANVDLLVSGSGRPRPAWVLAEEIRERFDGPVDLRLLYQRDEFFSVSAR